MELPKRWIVALALIGVLALAVIGVAGWNVSVMLTNSRQDRELAAANARIQVQEKIRAAEKRAACSRAIAGAELGNKIMDAVRLRFEKLADAVTNPDVQKVLRDSTGLPEFPVPLPGCPAPPPGRPA